MQWITNRRRAQSRLPRLVTWLRKVSDHINGASFHLDTFRGTEDYPSQPRNVQEAKRCGFEGCALGWASINPWFRKAGLRMEYDDGEWLSFCAATLEAADFFGISEEAVYTIFAGSDVDWNDGPWTYDSEQDYLDAEDPIVAAERIERFCTDNGIALEGGVR